jgi:hypothetical protein
MTKMIYSFMFIHANALVKTDPDCMVVATVMDRWRRS